MTAELETLRHTLALTYIPGVGPATVRALLAYYGDFPTIFRQNRTSLEAVPGIGPQTAKTIADALRQAEILTRADQELEYCAKYQLHVLGPQDAHYPALLREIPDAPLVLFYRGELSALRLGSKSVSIVGTRRATAYGKELVSRLVHDLSAQAQGTCVVSGLAHGIDGEAHRAALQNNLPTIGVLGHGFRHFYPSSHREMARQMLSNGGLLTEFPSTREPDTRTFLQRNRIIAGMTAATIVGESARKGGAMVTAQYAETFGRGLLCFPGNVGKTTSEGCNLLIKEGRAQLIESADDLIRRMGWTPGRQQAMKAALLYAPSPEEEKILSAIREAGSISLDDLSRTLQMAPGPLNAQLFTLELNGVIRQLPGKNFELGS